MAASGRSRFWFDPRFAIGLGLIVVSVVGTTMVVTAADNSVEVLVARETLTPGSPIDRGSVVVRRAAVEPADVYLHPGDLDDELVAGRVVGQGELVPRSAVAADRDADRTAVVVSVDGELAASVQAGAGVEVWASTVAEDGGDGPPAVIASDALVSRVAEGDALAMSSGSGHAVELLVGRSEVAVILEALSREASIAIVPAVLPAGR